MEQGLVSILVMLEVKWKAKLWFKSISIFSSFNPCYVGSKMESLVSPAFIQIQLRFNPCYVGSKMERQSKQRYESITDTFQSLLCWK